MKDMADEGISSKSKRKTTGHDMMIEVVEEPERFCLYLMRLSTLSELHKLKVNDIKADTARKIMISTA